MTDLERAQRLLSEAQTALGNLWMDCTDVRTPRLVDAINLLERASAKLRKESERQERCRTGRRPESQFSMAARALMEGGNAPLTWDVLMRATGISHDGLSQVVHVSHKRFFASAPLPGY